MCALKCTIGGNAIFSSMFCLSPLRDDRSFQIFQFFPLSFLFRRFSYQLVRVGAGEAAVVKAVLGPGSSVEVEDDVQPGIPDESGKPNPRSRDVRGEKQLV